MQQKQTEQDYAHTDGEQDTGNHRAPGAPPKSLGGTRTGADNIEAPKTNIEQGTDVDKVANLKEDLEDSISVNGPTERTAERDERGRI